MDHILYGPYSIIHIIFSFISLTLEKVMDTLNLPHWFTPSMISEIFGNNYFVDVIKVLKFLTKISVSGQNAHKSLGRMDADCVLWTISYDAPMKMRYKILDKS